MKCFCRGDLPSAHHSDFTAFIYNSKPYIRCPHTATLGPVLLKRLKHIGSGGTSKFTRNAQDGALADTGLIEVKDTGTLDYAHTFVTELGRLVLAAHGDRS